MAKHPGSLRRYSLRLALACMLAVPAAARAARPDGERGNRDDRQEELERRGIEVDDPAARIKATRQLRESEPTAEGLIHLLQVARRERDKVGSSSPAGGSANQLGAVPGNVWINLGPARADFEVNGGRYDNVDSGRARQIVPHPADPNIVYMATSGGGVWKTYDAGAHWEPLTDRLGALSIGTLAMDPKNPDILYLGFGDPFDARQPGVVSSTNGGATWTDPVFPVASYTVGASTLQSPASRVHDLKVDPNNSAAILLATEVGLFRSTDGAHTFTQAVLPDAAAHALAVQAWSIAWMGGTTWLVSGRFIDLSGGAAPASLHLFRSTDSGNNWALADAGLPTGATAGAGRCTLAAAASTLDNAATSRAYAICATVDDAKSATYDLLRTDDGGVHWKGLAVNATRVPSNPNDDQTDLNVMHGQAWYNQAIIVDPTDPNTVFIGGNLSMIRTNDGGTSWSVVSDWLPTINGIAQPYVHADFHAFGVSVSGATKTWYVGTDGGIFKSTDLHNAAGGSATVSDTLNRGLVSHLAYSVACAPEAWPPSMQGFAIGGLQDNGTRMRDLGSAGGPDTFNQVIGGDGIGVAVSPAVSGGVPADMVASVAAGWRYSNDGGATWSRFDRGLVSGTPPFFVRYASDDAAADGRTFLTFTDPTTVPDSNIYRSVAGNDWTSINGSVHNLDGTVGGTFLNVLGQQIFFHLLSTHPKKAGIYGATASAALSFTTPDGGANWYAAKPLGSNSTRNKAVRSTTGLAFDPTDLTGQHFWEGTEADVLFDTANAKDAGAIPDDFGHLFVTTDRGQNWTSVLGGQAGPGTRLPNVPITVVKVDPNDAQTLYVGTYVGLYRSTDGGANFSRFGSGLPLVKISDMCIAPGSSNIKVATYGRGFWQLNTTAGGNSSGVRGGGDLDFDQRIDAFDLIALVGAMGTTNADDSYRQEADVDKSDKLNRIDDADLAEFLAHRFGGTP